MKNRRGLQKKELDKLYSAILQLKSVKECRAFFRDLCTLGELQEFSERWQVACMIDEGMAYRAIAKKTRVSTATIVRVGQWLHHGKNGYRLMIDRLRRVLKRKK